MPKIIIFVFHVRSSMYFVCMFESNPFVTKIKLKKKIKIFYASTIFNNKETNFNQINNWTFIQVGLQHETIISSIV